MEDSSFTLNSLICNNILTLLQRCEAFGGADRHLYSAQLERFRRKIGLHTFHPISRLDASLETASPLFSKTASANCQLPLDLRCLIAVFAEREKVRSPDSISAVGTVVVEAKAEAGDSVWNFII